MRITQGSKKKMKTPIEITRLLRKYHVLHLATGHQNVIQSAPLYFAVAENGRDLIFISANTSAHMRAIRTQPVLALSIAPASPTIDSVEGIQAHGRLHRKQPSQAALRARYLARFPSAQSMVANASGHEFHLIQVTWARVITPLGQSSDSETEWTFDDSLPKTTR
jgi:uncharacterized protein YhbP (UPF0306 family)